MNKEIRMMILKAVPEGQNPGSPDEIRGNEIFKI